jgi:hypothetical protein
LPPGLNWLYFILTGLLQIAFEIFQNDLDWIRPFSLVLIGYQERYKTILDQPGKCKKKAPRFV